MSTHALTPPLALVTLLRRPLRHVPYAAQQALLGPLLGQVFAARAAEGELDFLDGRTLAIDIRDLGLCWHVTFTGGRLRVVPRDGEATARVSGDVLAFLQLASREEDADTLFFQRRLVMQGDTGIGLQAKNLLDGMAPEALPLPLRQALAVLLAVEKRLHAGDR